MSGGGISHDFGLRFNSPFVNLAIPANEFVDLLYDIKKIEHDIIDVSDNKHNYPIGLLSGKFTLYFVHYKSFKDAVISWRKRAKRVDYIHPYIILVETSTCSYEDLLKFDKLPYKNKITLVHKDYPGINCKFVLEGYDGKNLHGEVLNYNGLFGKRMYDQVDWISFLQLK